MLILNLYLIFLVVCQKTVKSKNNDNDKKGKSTITQFCPTAARIGEIHAKAKMKSLSR